MAKAPLLDLTTLIERPAIRIDGATYHLKSVDELSVIESQRFSNWGTQLEEFGKDPDADPDAHEDLVRKIAQAAVADVPAELFAKLATSQMMAIVEVFTSLLLAHRLTVAEALARQVSRSIGARSSQGSSAAMAATPDTGSPSPRLHS